ncbi:hypothetical protein ACWERW_14005 [Streptomyces sp. NPDC004012]
MKDKLTWAALLPVVTFAAGLLATQLLEWVKERRQRWRDRQARRHAIADNRHEYELRILTDIHSTLPELIKHLALHVGEAHSSDTYSPEHVSFETTVKIADLLGKTRTLAAVVFDDALRVRLDGLANRAVGVIQATSQQSADERMSRFRDEHHGVVEVTGERIRALYAELLASS